MYTLHMSWPLRALVFSFVLAWAAVPQLACFMPEQALTSAEMDCCKNIAGDCSATNLSQTCCRAVVRQDVGIVTKAIRNATPGPDAAVAIADLVLPAVPRNSDEFATRNDHAPPDQFAASFVVLRI